MKKSILFLLLTLFSLQSIADVINVSIDDFIYTIHNTSIENDRAAYLTGSRINSGAIIIPDTVLYQGIKYPVKSIESSVFYNYMDLISVTLPNTITKIGSSAFNGCTGLISISLSNSLISIEGAAFKNCTVLTSITLSNSLTSIGGEAFYGCKSLTNITIPYSVTSIGNSAFYYCENLQDITCLAVTPPATGNFYCFFPVYYMATTTLHVPERSLEAYKAYDYWSYFLNIEGDAADFTPSSNNTDKCDTNGDGEVNIADVNRVIDRILSK